MDSNGSTLALLIGVYATLAMDVFSTFTSSPQTTELNAKARSKTLMKWVTIAAVVGVGFGAAGSIADRRWAPVLVVSAVVLGMVFTYRHANRAGLESPEPGTESY